MVDVVGTALHFIADYGLIAIFVLLVLDAAMLLPVFPGEVVLVMAVAAYATDYASLAFLVALTTAAGLLGSLLLYGIMRGGGRKLVERYPRLFMMPRKRREKMERSFQRPLGQTLVLVLRLVPLTRVLVNIPAGLARMKVVRFVLLTTIGLLLYHTAFLWFTYEVNRPGSTLATQRQQFSDAYGSPAMEFVAANAIASALVVLAIGCIVSVRASRAILRDPEEAGGSFFGWLTTMVLLWGGMAIGVTAYIDPATLVDLAAVRGVDVPALARLVGVTIAQFLLLVAGVMLGIGAILRGLATYAASHRRRFDRERRAQEAGRDRGIRQWQRGPDDDLPEDVLSFEGTTAPASPRPPSAAPPPGRRPGT
jgi:membrane protein DedA with SNARE-associated domain